MGKVKLKTNHLIYIIKYESLEEVENHLLHIPAQWSILTIVLTAPQ